MKYTTWIKNDETDEYDIVEVSKEEYISDCLIELIEQGIDEDRHFFGQFWRDLDVNDLKEVINHPKSLAKMLEFATEGIKEQLEEVVEGLTD